MLRVKIMVVNYYSQFVVTV